VRGLQRLLKVCPVGAISGKVKEPFEIDPNKCIKCGACFARCKFGAIEKK
jgi:Fe-S-cluster-containing hydrogenase component 2